MEDRLARIIAEMIQEALSREAGKPLADPELPSESPSSASLWRSPGAGSPDQIVDTPLQPTTRGLYLGPLHNKGKKQ